MGGSVHHPIAMGLEAPLTPADFRRLARLSARLPLAWTASPRRRRLLLVGLAAPGFLLVAATPLHRLLALMVLGAALFVLALVFRRKTEPVFLRAEAADLWPPVVPARPENPHA